MDIFDFYFRQLVTEAEMDDAFAAVEEAINAVPTGLGLTGIVSAGTVVENTPSADLNVIVVGPFVAFDADGNRIAFVADQTVDMSVDEDAISTSVGTPGNEKTLSIFAKYERVLSDSRLDGNGDAVLYSRADGYTLNVVQGTEAAIGTSVAPALRADEVLICDIVIENGTTAIATADIDFTRRQMAVVSIPSAQVVGEAGSNLGTPLIEDSRNTNSDPALILEAQDASGATIRLYTGLTNVRNGLTITRNCSWNAGTNLWVSDASGVARKVTFLDAIYPVSVSIHTAATAGETWADTDAAWDHYEAFRARVQATQTTLELTNEGAIFLSGTHPGSGASLVDAGKLYRTNIVKAWATVQSDGGGGTGTVNDGFRVNGASVPSANILRLVISPPMSDTNYCVVATNVDGSDRMLWTVDAKATTHVDLQCFNVVTGTLVNFDSDIRRAGVMIIGQD